MLSKVQTVNNVLPLKLSHVNFLLSASQMISFFSGLAGTKIVNIIMIKIVGSTIHQILNLLLTFFFPFKQCCVCQHIALNAPKTIMCLWFNTACKPLLLPSWYFELQEFLKLWIYLCLGALDKWRYCWFLFIRWHHRNFQSSPFAFMKAHQFKRIKSQWISCRKSVTQGSEQ